MSNTLGGINLAQIANETLAALLIELNRINAFTKDFSTDIRSKGASVSTRVPSAVTAQDLSSGYSATDVTSTAKTITLNKFKGFVLGFTDEEVSKAGDVEYLKSIFIQPAVSATLNAVMDDLLALVLNAAFSGNTVITAANFDADSLATLAATLSTANVPKMGRYAMLSPSYMGSLAKDNSIQNASAYGDRNAIVNNSIPRVHGFDLLEYNDIPNNSENLAGIVGTPDALLIAARQPADPPFFPGMVENVADPVTGLPLQFRAWYDADAGVAKISVGLLYGVAVGNGGSLHRIKSA